MYIELVYHMIKITLVNIILLF